MISTPILSGYVTKTSNTLRLGNFRFPRRVLRIHVEVIEAFNSNGSDTLTVGNADDTDAYATSIDVSTTGIKTVTLGSGVGYDITPQDISAFYSAGGSAPTTGIVAIAVEYAIFPPKSV